MIQIFFKLVVLIVLGLVSCLSSHAQITLSGIVKDSISGERLIGAHVIELNKHNGMVTDKHGYFTIKTDTPSTIKISFIGYQPAFIDFTNATDTIMIIGLLPGTLLDEVTMQAYTLTSPGVVALDKRNIERMPALGGKPDIAKSLQLFPGIATQSEGSSLLLVRGGDPGQNLYLLDGVPLIYVNRLGGFASVFEPEMVSDIKAYKGAFHPSHGGKLSSIIEIAQKEGSRQTHKGLVSIGITDVSFLAEGPTPIKNSSFIVSGRKTLTEPILYYLTSRSEGNNNIFTYGFHDVNAKLSWRPNIRNSIHFNIYQGDDYLGLRTKKNPRRPNDAKREHNTWGNLMGSLRWNSLRTSTLFFSGNLSFSMYRLKSRSRQQFQSNNEIKSSQMEMRSEVKDLSMRLGWKYSPGTNWTLEFGSQNSLFFYSPSIIKNTQNPAFSRSIRAQSLEHALYFNNSLNLTSRWNAQLGLRFTIFKNKNYVLANPEPRLGLNYEFFPNKRLNISYTRMIQNSHLLFNAGSFLNNEIWIPAQSMFPPSLANQYSIGFNGLFDQGGFEAELTFFYKEMERLATYKEGYTSLLGNEDWPSKVEANGSGISKGLEVLVKKNLGKYKGHIAYTFSRTTRTYPGINRGNTFLFDFDRPHDFAFAISHDLTPNISLTAHWIFQTGLPFTPAIGRQYTTDFQDNDPYIMETLIFGDRNSARMRNHHRLDLGIQYQRITSRGNNAIWSFSIYNLYNRKNATYYYYSFADGHGIGQSKPGEFNQVKLYQMTALPFFPSVSYKVYFDAAQKNNQNRKSILKSIKNIFIYE